ncbi:MAG TPA: tRNA dihydrouridine synthase DusB [Verrucomicrobiae bacterium]|nr:tRNA dihydrouridine synthase DusB [Verrucomicrobiae bacterium]
MHKFFDNPAERIAPAGACVPASVSLGGVEIRPATVLAPMAGVTDTVFRRFIRNLCGCGLMMTEFTSADGIVRHKDKKAKQYLTFYGNEHPISAQLFGSDPKTLSDAARVVQDLGFDLVDLNLGCPAKKVVKCNGGSGLLRDLPLIRNIFESVRSAVTIPFTVKFRAGWSDQEIVHVNLAKMAEDCGLAGVALHARTREQGYSGQAHWEWIAAVKDAVKIPVIGNGDVRSPEDAAAMVAQTGCDAVMIGRSAPSNPWIFRQIEQFTLTGSYDLPTDADRYQMIRTYFAMLVEEKRGGEEGKMKQFAAWFTHGVPHGAHLRKAVYESKTGQQILDAVDQFFESLLNGTVAIPASEVQQENSAATLIA